MVPNAEPLPKLPVARALWLPQPNFEDGIAAWILAGGAHHTGFSLSLTAEHVEDFATIAGILIEYLLIGNNSSLADIKKKLNME